MCNLEFINRKLELQQLKNEFIDELDKKIIFVVGKTGVGKTAFTERSQCDLPFKVQIRVSTESYSYTKTPNGYYILKLGEQVNKKANYSKEFSSISNFMKYIYSPIVRKRIKNAIIEDIASSIHINKTVTALKDLFENEDELANKMFNSSRNENIYLIQEYIIKELADKNFLLIIENIQCIDEVSLNFLSKLIKKTTKGNFLFEYTLNTNISDLHIITEKIHQQFSCIKTLKLEPIDLEEFKDFFLSYPELTYEIVKNSSLVWDGNLKPLMDIFTTLKYASKRFNKEKFVLSEGSKILLSQLSKNEFFLLCLINTHQDRTSFRLLKQLYRFKEIKFIDIDIVEDRLLTLKLIKKESGYLSLEHDSLANEMKNQPNYKYMEYMALKYWFEIYNKMIKSGDLYLATSYLIKKLFLFATKLNLSEEVFNLFDILSTEIFKTNSSLEFLINIIELRKSLQTTKANKTLLFNIDIKITSLLHSIGSAKLAFSHLQSIQKKNNIKVQLLQCILLEELGEPTESIRLAKKWLKEKEIDMEYRSFFRLILFTANFNLQPISKLKKYFFSLYNDNDFHNSIALGFLLRNAEYIFSYSDSIKYLKESIVIFNQIGLERQQAFSLNSLAFSLARIGKLEQAIENIEKAESIISKFGGESHTLLNNLAACKMYSLNINQEIEDLLLQALVSADMDFDKITIYSNLIVYYCMNTNYENIDDIVVSVEEILESPTFFDKNIIRQVYFNIFQYYKKIGKPYRIYLDKVKELNLPMTQLWKYWLYNGTPPKGNDFFQSKFKYSIAFLSHWHIDFDNTLEKNL